VANIFVTGGSGFIGRALIRRLVSEGHSVSALVRSDASAAVVGAAGAIPVRGELTIAATWQDQLRGCDVLFHLAAETDLDAAPEQHRQVTVVGTQSAIDAARWAGIPRFVHCGSEAALLAGDPLVEADETAPLRPDSEAVYSAVKAQAEQIVMEAASREFGTVSIRPRFVWGPESSLITGLARSAAAGTFAWIEGGHHVTDITYVDNAVEGLLLGWRRGRSGEAYFITDQHRVDFRDFLTDLFADYGVTAPTLKIDSATALRTVPVPARWFLGQVCTLSTAKAVEELGYAPVITHSDARSASAAWAAHAMQL
jgi:nucleoside-diphosphate-sugar epimerase